MMLGMDKWQAIRAVEPRKLKDLFAVDAARVERLTVEDCGIALDFSKTHLDEALLAAFATLAEQSGLAAKREAMFTGQIVNVTEGRAVEHCAERGEGAADSVQRAKALHQRMRGLIEVIEAGALGDIRHILHVGIGGSALGPDLLVDALGRDAGRYDVAIVSNVDGAALKEAFARFDPAKTLLAIASKTFTTTETMLNAESAINWMIDAGVDDAYGRVIALTANPAKAVEWGVDETRIALVLNRLSGGPCAWLECV
jgi:glucose-6-phosphate isomerase